MNISSSISIVVSRWWAQYSAIPWPDNCCLLVSTCIMGNDDRLGWGQCSQKCIQLKICPEEAQKKTTIDISYVQGLKPCLFQSPVDSEDHRQIHDTGPDPDPAHDVHAGKIKWIKNYIYYKDPNQVKKRFPTLSHLCEVGVVTENEARIIQSIDDKCIGSNQCL